MGSDLQIATSVPDVSGLPAEGRDLVVVAAVQGVLHFRIFDTSGHKVVDLDETTLMGASSEIRGLREQLQTLRLDHKLTRSESDQIVATIHSIVGHRQLIDREDEPTHFRGGAHLTELETSWTTIRSAHLGGPEGQAAMGELIGRYHDAVLRYLRLKLRDANLADEVFQEFWTKLLDHKLAGADCNKGRFRDYLRTVLHRLIIDHFRGRKLQALPPGDLLDPNQPDDDYDQVWREAVLKRALARLKTYELNTPKNRYSAVLMLRSSNPRSSIDEIAAMLSEQVGTRISPESFRKTLQRARSKYFELLIQELRETIHPATDDDIEDEIQALGLGPQYRRYLGE